MVLGGVVVFDDYGCWGCEGITELCNELNIKNGTFIHNLNGHGIFVKHTS
jgi:O-methyltransferase